jgi:hypothetical protein
VISGTLLAAERRPDGGPEAPGERWVAAGSPGEGRLMVADGRDRIMWLR